MSKILFLPKEKHWNWKGGGKEKICPNCNKVFNKRTYETYKRFNERQTCCRKCADKYIRGEKRYNWKGGIRKANSEGYLIDSITKRTIHRQTMEHFLNRNLNKNELVHHINGDVTDNRIENLEIHSISSHMKLHNKFYKRSKNGRYCGK